MPFIGQPGRDFHRAKADFTKGDDRGAARQIRIAAAIMKLEAGRHNAANKQGLLTQANALDTLADKVEKKQVSSVNDLDRAFAKADLALARHYHLMAKAAMAAGNHRSTGTWLEAAAGSISDAADWSGRKLAAGESATLKGVHDLGSKMASGATWSGDQVKNGVSYLGAEIDKF